MDGLGEMAVDNDACQTRFPLFLLGAHLAHIMTTQSTDAVLDFVVPFSFSFHYIANQYHINTYTYL